MNPFVAHGCSIYTADHWKDGTNYGGKLVATTDIGPVDAPITESLKLAERIAYLLSRHGSIGTQTVIQTGGNP